MRLLHLFAWTASKPLLLALIVAGLGLLLLRGPRRRAGVWCISAGAVLAYLASTALVGSALLEPLERQFPVFEPTDSIGVRDIVVLGSGYSPYGHNPASGALDADGLARIVEGVRLALARPDSRLLVSGGAPRGIAASALGYAQLASELGIQRSALIVLDRGLDTDQEAREVAALLQHAPFILVTSSYHMPRAMLLMRLAGANPVPAPTGQILGAKLGTERFGFIPGSRGLRMTEAALHEYLGLAAIRLRID